MRVIGRCLRHRLGWNSVSDGFFNARIYWILWSILTPFNILKPCCLLHLSWACNTSVYRWPVSAEYVTPPIIKSASTHVYYMTKLVPRANNNYYTIRLLHCHIQMFFTVYVLGSLRLCKPETEGQEIQKENLMEKLQNGNQNFNNLAQESSVVTTACTTVVLLVCQ